MSDLVSSPTGHIMPSSGVSNGISSGNFSGIPAGANVIPTGNLLTGTLVASSFVPAGISLRSSSASVNTKTKLRYVIVKADGKTLELQELPQITAREMIGICKLLGFVSACATVLVRGLGGYNMSINWSQLIEQLGIQKHFIDGRSVGDYNNDAEVLDILLYDPQ